MSTKSTVVLTSPHVGSWSLEVVGWRTLGWISRVTHCIDGLIDSWVGIPIRMNPTIILLVDSYTFYEAQLHRSLLAWHYSMSCISAESRVQWFPSVKLLVIRRHSSRKWHYCRYIRWWEGGFENCELNGVQDTLSLFEKGCFDVTEFMTNEYSMTSLLKE